MYRKHVASIAGLRALAVGFVLLFHVNPDWLPGGFVGVDVFFVISGFVVAHSVANASYPSFKAFFAAFYVRRLQRILPASYVYIAIALVATALFIPLAKPTSSFEAAGASAAVGVSNIFLFLTSGDYFAEASDLNPFTHTWSLGVEEQYYLVFPLFSYLILVAGDRFPRARRIAVWGVAIAIGISLFGAFLFTRKWPIFAFYMLPTRFWELGIGFTLRYLLDAERSALIARGLGRSGSAAGIAALLALTISAIVTSASAFPFPGALLPCLSTAAVIAIVWCQPGSIVDRLLGHRIPVFFGNISYSLYLWHWGVLVLMRWTCGVDTLPLQLVALGLSVLFGWLSYRFVEQAFHNRETRGRAPSAMFFVRYAAVAGVVCLACGGASLLRPQIGLARANDVTLWDPYASPPLPADCPVAREESRLGKGMMSRFAAGCAKPGMPRLFVVGDSHAGAYRRAIWQLAGEGRVEPYLFTMGGCRLIYVNSTPPVPGCDAFRTAALQRLHELARPGDVVFLPGLHTTRYDSNDGSIRANDAEEIARSRQRVLKLTQLGVSVLVEGPKPVMPAPLYRCADRFNATNPACTGLRLHGPAENWARMEAVRPAIAAVAAGAAGVGVWYPDAKLCSEEACPPFLRGKPLYFDTDHLSAYANDLLLPDLSAAIYGKIGNPPAPPSR